MKDGFAAVLFLILFAAFVFFMPNALGHADKALFSREDRTDDRPTVDLNVRLNATAQAVTQLYVVPALVYRVSLIQSSSLTGDICYTNSQLDLGMIENDPTLAFRPRVALGDGCLAGFPTLNTLYVCCMYIYSIYSEAHDSSLGLLVHNRQGRVQHARDLSRRHVVPPRRRAGFLVRLQRGPFIQKTRQIKTHAAVVAGKS